MEQLICRSCGAPLRADGKCEYCGAVYRFFDSWHHGHSGEYSLDISKIVFLTREEAEAALDGDGDG